MIVILMVIIFFALMWLAVEQSIDRIMCGILYMILAFATIIGAFLLNDNQCNSGNMDIERIDIYSGYNGGEISGQFFLLSGSIDEKDVVYYWVDDNGVKSKHHQDMSDSVFVEDGSEYLLLKHNTCKEGWEWFFVCGGITAEFHVPEGSILQMYQYQ